MTTLPDYARCKQAERFLDSLMLAKPVPHFVAAKHAVVHPNPFGLERLQSFLKALKNPHRRNKYVHIAGTSGKTSTTYLTAALLQAQGCTTARFISPHLATAAEYLTINDRLPPVTEFVELIERLKPVIDREYETTTFGMISHAELMVALACCYFSEHAVDIVALEAFLGGRHDATNVIEQAEVSIVTNIGLDHTHILGNTVAAIAAEKVGILKTGCPLITAEQRPELLALFRAEAIKHHTVLEVFGEDFRVEHVTTTPSGTHFDYVSPTHTYRRLHTPIPGQFQAVNAALALRAVERVAAKSHRPLAEDAVRHAIDATRIPGRFEIVQSNPVIILDAAHNADKMAALITALQPLYQPDEIIFVCAFTSGRDPQVLFRSMLDVSRTFYLTRAIIGFREDEEPLYLKHVLTGLDPNANTRIALDPFRALDLATHEARQRGKIVCVTGSAYLVGHVRQRWHPEDTLMPD